MQLIAGLTGILLAFASMWVGWYVFKVWPDLTEENMERYKKNRNRLQGGS